MSTEETIIESAKKVFTTKGKAGARMQEIADHAGINKAMLHYYYRSKDQLFKAVFDNIVKEWMPKLLAVFNKDVPLDVKVYELADKYINLLVNNPQLPLFILNELQVNPEGLFRTLDIKRHIDLELIGRQIAEQVAAGKMISIRPDQFMINLLSLMVFPIAAAPMFKHVLGFGEEEFRTMILARKTEVPRFFINALRP